jgi:hypothetical protein
MLGIVDMVPLTGCFFKGFKDLKKTNVPMHYFGPIDPKSYEWYMEHILDVLVQDIQGNSLEVPGFTIPDMNPPADHMEDKPAPPTLKRLVIQKVLSVDQLKILYCFLINR